MYMYRQTFLHALLLPVELIERTLLQHLLHEERWLEAGPVYVHWVVLLLDTHTERERGDEDMRSGRSSTLVCVGAENLLGWTDMQ